MEGVLRDLEQGVGYEAAVALSGCINSRSRPENVGRERCTGSDALCSIFVCYGRNSLFSFSPTDVVVPNRTVIRSHPGYSLGDLPSPPWCSGSCIRLVFVVAIKCVLSCLLQVPLVHTQAHYPVDRAGSILPKRAHRVLVLNVPFRVLEPEEAARVYE